MGALSCVARPAELARTVGLDVLVEFEDMGEATRFMSSTLPRVSRDIHLTAASQDGDIARMTLGVGSASVARLRQTKRAVVGRSSGRVFFRTRPGRYFPWHSRAVREALLLEAGWST